jgi:ASC-1-like (ASCH) protein
MGVRHDLKIEEEYLENLKTGRKKAEIRLNDRDYQVGDTLRFTDYKVSCGGRPTKREFKITHIHSGLGMEKNYVALSVEQIEPGD